MISLAIFAIAFLVAFLVNFGLLHWRMRGGWSRDQPSVVGDRLRLGNRILAAIVLGIVVVIALLEMYVPTVGYWVVESQYVVGDRLVQELTFHQPVGSGTLSWGLYLAVFLGILLGAMAGDWAAMRSYPVLRGLSFRSLLFRR